MFSKIIPSFFTIKKGIFLPLRLSCKESSTFLTKPLFPQEREDVTALRCSEPLRYKVGGPSKVTPYCAGWDRLVAMHSIPSLKPYLHGSAKKEIKNIQGNTVTFDMSEADIVMLNSAIVESYIMKASNIYIAKYVEPGMQEKAANTYVPTAEVIRLIETDSNIVSTAKNELTSRFDANIRNQMNSTVNQYSEQGLTNVEEGIQKQIEDAKKAREEYLSSLAQ